MSFCVTDGELNCGKCKLAVYCIPKETLQDYKNKPSSGREIQFPLPLFSSGAGEAVHPKKHASVGTHGQR